MRGHYRRLWAIERNVEPMLLTMSTPCWVWQGDVRRNYPILKLPGTGGRQRQMAHRFFWEREHGPVPEDHDLHHRCEMPFCVNPAHMKPVPGCRHKGLHPRMFFPPRLDRFGVIAGNVGMGVPSHG